MHLIATPPTQPCVGGQEDWGRTQVCYLCEVRSSLFQRIVALKLLG